MVLNVLLRGRPRRASRPCYCCTRPGCAVAAGPRLAAGLALAHARRPRPLDSCITELCELFSNVENSFFQDFEN